jgi:hypothetical protein
MTSAGGTTAFAQEPVVRENITFATTANITANQVIISGIIADTHTSVSITMPRALLVNSGQAAEYIYLMLGTNAGNTGENAAQGTDRYTRTTNNRLNTARNMGGINAARELDFFNPIELDIHIPPCADCNAFPCECPDLCVECEKLPCECPCVGCEKLPCECPCVECEKFPCECPCKYCDEYPCECPSNPFEWVVEPIAANAVLMGNSDNLLRLEISAYEQDKIYQA